MSEPKYDLKQIIELMKANKVLHVKLGNLEVSLSPSAFTPDVPTDKTPTDKMPTEEDFLFASSPWIADEITPSEGPHVLENE
jgi:hypothetical protein